MNRELSKNKLKCKMNRNYSLKKQRLNKNEYIF